MKKILLLNIGLILFSALHAQEKINFGVASNSTKSADRKVDSLRKLLITKDTTVKKPAPKKPANQQPQKPAEAIENKKKQ